MDDSDFLKILMIVGIVIITLILTFGFGVVFGAPYVPSWRREAASVLDACGLGEGDTLVDVGSGGGVVLRLAAERGARAVGYEINIILVVLARIMCLRSRNTKIFLANALKADWPADTSTVYVFGVERIMPKLEEKLRRHVGEHRKTIELISYGFEIPNRRPTKTHGAYYIYEF